MTLRWQSRWRHAFYLDLGHAGPPIIMCFTRSDVVVALVPAPLRRPNAHDCQRAVRLSAVAVSPPTRPVRRSGLLYPQARSLVGCVPASKPNEGDYVDIRIKNFDVRMSVKSKGIEFEVRSPDGEEHLGDCYLTMTGVIWCPGKTTKQNGVKISWDDLTTVLASAETKRAAVRAARNA